MRDEKLRSVFAHRGEVPRDVREKTEETLSSLKSHPQVTMETRIPRRKRMMLRTAVVTCFVFVLVTLFAAGQHIGATSLSSENAPNSSSEMATQSTVKTEFDLDALEKRIESISSHQDGENAASGIDYVSLEHDLQKTLNRYRERIENAASEDEQSALWEELVNRLDSVCGSYGVDGQILGLPEPGK